MTSPRHDRDRWSPGDVAHFEYHCWESPLSSDADLWRRSHQIVSVLGIGDGEPASLTMTLAEREAAAMPLVYDVRFPDGHEGTVWEDELLTSAAGYCRPAPPVTA